MGWMAWVAWITGLGGMRRWAWVKDASSRFCTIGNMAWAKSSASAPFRPILAAWVRNRATASSETMAWAEGAAN